MNDFFQLDIEHGIAHLQLNRPERMNTMAPAFFPLAIAGSKLAINHARDHGTAAALHQMTLLQSAIFDSTEMALAIDA